MELLQDIGCGREGCKRVPERLIPCVLRHVMPDRNAATSPRERGKAGGLDDEMALLLRGRLEIGPVCNRTSTDP